jgi:hypothetical protein
LVDYISPAANFCSGNDANPHRRLAYSALNFYAQSYSHTTSNCFADSDWHRDTDAHTYSYSYPYANHRPLV